MSSPALPMHPDAPWLAPLAGWSDLPFRLLCREYGAAVCCTEMVSARGLVYEGRNGGRATHELLATSGRDRPLVVQLFGEDPEFMSRAVHQLAERGVRYFDCNMGCSVPKVTRTGAGAALLREPERALAVAGSMVEAARSHGALAGFKLRLGWEAASRTVFELARRFEELGASWLTLHPRTAAQGFSGAADWEQLSVLVRSVSLPVIASGDLWTAEDGVRCLRETGAAAVMYARGALRDPAVFARYRALRHPEGASVAVIAEEEAPEVLHARMLRHAELAREFSSPHTALLKMRTAIPRYVRHLEGASRLRREIIACRSWDDFTGALERFFSALPPSPQAAARDA